MSENIEGGVELVALVRREVERALKALRETPAASRPELLTQADAAALLGVSVSTIRNWLRDRKLTKYGSGKVVRVSRAELLALKASSAEPDAKAPAADADAWAAARMRRGG
ncbi:helix-turn-helix domain-containing protein [Corallococcus sp. AS-1-6]|uniref:helix-turn-helix domain-containing protein n=1 Tax=Corallococcus sp. AS-1-6 TaxID=2874599 RepID=UPI001CBE93AB|nr:helix-turn-helix domain-containing protein [Corallococcus sp. AS-1-6]